MLYMVSRINRKLATSELLSYVGKPLSLRTLRRILNSDFRSLGVRTCIVQDPDMLKSPFKRSKFAVSGWFDMDGRKMPITMNINVPNKDDLCLTKKQMNRMLFYVAQTVQHEYLHKLQCRKKPDIDKNDVKVYYSDRLSKKRVDEMVYLADEWEVDAYARDIAHEIKQFYPQLGVREALRNIVSLRKVNSFKHYSKAFKGTNWDVLRRTLLKKVWKWLDRVIPTPVCP
jgi:hypothetical protein